MTCFFGVLSVCPEGQERNSNLEKIFLIHVMVHFFDFLEVDSVVAQMIAGDDIVW